MAEIINQCAACGGLFERTHMNDRGVFRGTFLCAKDTLINDPFVNKDQRKSLERQARKDAGYEGKAERARRNFGHKTQEAQA